MPGSTIGTSMNYGYPGTYSRNGDNITRQFPVLSTDASGPAFGAAVVLNPDSTGGTISDAAVSMANGHTPTMSQGVNYTFVGIAVREVLTQQSFAVAQPITPLIQKYQPGQPCDVLERGNISVIVKDPQANGYKAGGNIFLRTVVNGAFPSAAVGDLETLADAGKTVQLTNCFLTTGLVDANSVAEICLVSRNTP